MYMYICTVLCGIGRQPNWQYLLFVSSHTGHNMAKLDPLGINEADLDSSTPPELIVDSSLDSGKVHVHSSMCIHNVHLYSLIYTTTLCTWPIKGGLSHYNLLRKLNS